MKNITTNVHLEKKTYLDRDCKDRPSLINATHSYPPATTQHRFIYTNQSTVWMKLEYIGYN